MKSKRKSKNLIRIISSNKRSSIPPISVQKAAKQGLELRKQYGRGGLSTREAGKLGIGSGVARASSLARGQRQSVATLKKMRNFFNRHAKNLNTPPEKGNGLISSKLWGGHGKGEGRDWANKELKRLGY